MQHWQISLIIAIEIGTYTLIDNVQIGTKMVQSINQLINYFIVRLKVDQLQT